MLYIAINITKIIKSFRRSEFNLNSLCGITLSSDTKSRINTNTRIEQNHCDVLFMMYKHVEFLFLAGLRFGLGGSQGGQAASLGNLLLTFLFGLLYNKHTVGYYWVKSSHHSFSSHRLNTWF